MVNFSAASLSKLIGFLLVLICWTTGMTGAAFSFEEEFLQLKENYIQMKEIVKSLESKVTEQDSLLFDLLREKNERIKINSDSVSMNQSALAITGLPSSCGDLKMIGHIWSGFYSVMGSAKMESVYCDFTKQPSDTGFQKWIGYADVKSAPVHFYVQRRTSFSAVNTPIPFELTRVNDGNAMDSTSGLFTAPRPGIYFFSFTGLVNYLQASSSRVGLGLGLFLNGARIGEGYVATENTATYQFCPVTLQSTLTLKKGDQIIVQITDIYPGVQLYDDNWQRTHFTGFMLEEEIVASL